MQAGLTDAAAVSLAQLAEINELALELLAVRIMAAINARFGIEVSVRDVFESPTVVALAHCLEQQQQLRALHSDLTVAGAQDESDRELVEI